MVAIFHERHMRKILARASQAILIAGAGLFLLLAIGAPTAPTLAALQAGTTVRVNPSVLTVTTSIVSAPLDIVMDNVEGLYAVDVRLKFDPALLAVRDADPTRLGTQIELGPLLTSGTYFVLFNTADNVSGTIQLVMTQLNPTPPVTGSGVVARIAFTTTGMTGISPVEFTLADLRARNGDPLAATVQNGRVVIVPVPIVSEHKLFLPIVMKQ